MSLPSPNPHPTASLLRRIAAFVYDAFLLFAITLAYGLLLTVIKVIFNGTQQLEEIQPGLLLQCLIIAGWLATLMGYYYISWRKQGQTLGMKSCAEPTIPRWNYKRAKWFLFRHRTSELTKDIRVEGRDINMVVKDFKQEYTQSSARVHTQRGKKELQTILE